MGVKEHGVRGGAGVPGVKVVECEFSDKIAKISKMFLWFFHLECNNLKTCGSVFYFNNN